MGNFSGEWSLVPAWEESKIEVCQGHPLLADMANDLVMRKRSEYVLGDRLKKYPLSRNLIILNCPATLGMLNVNALEWAGFGPDSNKLVTTKEVMRSDNSIICSYTAIPKSKLYKV